MPVMSRRLEGFTESVIRGMTRLANRHHAINLSQGFPDFDPPSRLVDLVAQHMRGGRNQYAPMAGWPALCEAVAAKIRALYGRVVSATEEVTISSGGTEALFCAVQAVVRTGDEVIILEPAYDSYEPAIELAGGRAVRVPLRRPDFTVDWDRVKEALTPRTRLLIVNTPHNPSGSAFSREDLDALADVLHGSDAFVLSDEVYEHMLFDGRAHESLLTRPELAERSYVVSSFGKTYHATGWKVGYCIAPAALTVEFRKMHQFVQFAVATPLQAGLADFLVGCPEHHRELPAFYQQKRDHFCRLLAQTPFAFTPSAGTYFQLADYSAVSRVPDVEFARWLTQEIGVAAIPISVFSAVDPPAHIVRFCFAKHEATLDAAGDRLRRIRPR